MNEIKKIASDRQSAASDPSSSAWVSANAGSGKTHVLVNRVIRLMLTGTPPERILCLTYTRAAAAEMSNRLFERLSQWIPLDDDNLITKIHENTGHTKFTKHELAEPRRLFARALETPGGLKIQTIHAFCEQLLHQFPLEAGVTTGFKVMDDRQAKEMSARIRDAFLSKILLTQDRDLAKTLEQVVKFAGGQTGFDKLLDEQLSKRREFQIAYEDLDTTNLAIAERLSVSPSDTVEDFCEAAFSTLDRTGLTKAIEVLATQAPKFVNVANHIAMALNATSLVVVFETLKSVFLTADGKVTKRLYASSTLTTNPDIAEMLTLLAETVCAINEKVKSIEILDSTIALLKIGKTINTHYDAEKKSLGLYDYQDLISRVLDMFGKMPDAGWVLFKLDGGLDHILIDEAQDTNPAQWEIIEFLADDFFSGIGAREETSRSVFAVGDQKQSIYSFQGAAPRAFTEQKNHYERLTKKGGYRFTNVGFEVSFRSTSAVLKIVDMVFDQEIAAVGVDKTHHIASRELEPGLVEMWPLEENRDIEKEDIWNPQKSLVSTQSSIVRLADKIARKIKSWFDEKIVLASTGKPIQPHDILILVRNRSQIMPSLVRALKLHDIPIAGMDRLKLTRHIAVQDLLCLCQFTQLVQDDLVFAGLLKSPLLEKDDGTPFDDNDLIGLAAERGHQPLWHSFLEKTDLGAPYSSAKHQLQHWITLSKELLPFEFFSSVLTHNYGRKKLLTRLGQEAGEPLDAFLDLTIEFENTQTASLQGFLNWIAASDTEIKREMEETPGEVRIMTIHGAKGLESKIVILPDTYGTPDKGKMSKIIDPDSIAPLWTLNSKMNTRQINDLKSKQFDQTKQEYNRLLYVAMTRASDRLYIGAAESKNKLADSSWYKLIENVMATDDLKTPDGIFGTVWRYEEASKFLTEPAEINQGEHEFEMLPSWVKSNPPASFARTQWLSPSKLTAGQERTQDIYFSPVQGQVDNKFLRGKLIHKLLQYLPDITEPERISAAEDFLKIHGLNLSFSEKADIVKEVSAVLSDKTFGHVFSQQSMAEVPVVAKMNDGAGNEIIVSGQIDRLAIYAHEVLIIDFKTNRPPPRDISGINQKYISQLAAYRATLTKLYPSRKIRAALLWTNNCTLMEIPQANLDATFKA